MLRAQVFFLTGVGAAAVAPSMRGPVHTRELQTTGVNCSTIMVPEECSTVTDFHASGNFSEFHLPSVCACARTLSEDQCFQAQLQSNESDAKAFQDFMNTMCQREEAKVAIPSAASSASDLSTDMASPDSRSTDPTISDLGDTPEAASLPADQANGGSGNYGTILIATGIVLAVLLVSIICVGYWCGKRRSGKAPTDSNTGSTNFVRMARTPRSNNQSNLTSPPSEPARRVPFPSTTSAGGGRTISAIRIPRGAIHFGPLLSRGGFGEVYKGTYMGETVAIKQLLPERRKDMVYIDVFMAEVKLMSSLEHERIVRFIGVAWNSLSDACMVVEYMENGDLRSVLARWDGDEERRPNGFDADKAKIALHIAHALTYLHSLQPVVVHRDLKSKNILLDKNLDAKLTDYGVSRERAESTMTAGVGTSLWMAPEVLLGERYDEKADVFSFGVVLSELDTHKLPYANAKASLKLPDAAILNKVSLGLLSIEFTELASPSIVQLGRDCVLREPEKRPTAADLLYRIHNFRQELI